MTHPLIHSQTPNTIESHLEGKPPVIEVLKNYKMLDFYGILETLKEQETRRIVIDLRNYPSEQIKQWIGYWEQVITEGYKIRTAYVVNYKSDAITSDDHYDNRIGLKLHTSLEEALR